MTYSDCIRCHKSSRNQSTEEGMHRFHVNLCHFTSFGILGEGQRVSQNQSCRFRRTVTTACSFNTENWGRDGQERTQRVTASAALLENLSWKAKRIDSHGLSFDVHVCAMPFDAASVVRLHRGSLAFSLAFSPAFI